ncbi:TPA: hypothetical protein DF272_06850 [Candidatus Falkowbacteria bacterium]|nr:hypothetical protein [Candidatus Falkowbacteria bacterium]
MKKIINYLILAIVFFLPWQTRWIYQANEVNGQFSEHTSLYIYGTEILIGILLGLAIIQLILTLGRKKIRPVKTFKFNVIILVAMAIFAALTIWYGVNYAISLQKIVWLILGAAMAGVIVMTRIKSELIMKAFLAATTIQAGYALHQFFTQYIQPSKWFGVAEQYPKLLGTPVIEINGERIMRAFGSLPHPNILGGFLCIGIIFAVAILAKEKQANRRTLLLIMLAMNSLALFMSASRSAILALVIGLGIYYLFSAKKLVGLRPSLNRALMIIFLLAIFFSTANHNFSLARFDGGNRLEQQSVNDRVTQYQEAGQVIRANWLTGVGPGNYVAALINSTPTKNIWDYQLIHNIYGLLITEFGFLLIPIGVLMYLLVKNLGLGWRKLDNEYALALRIALIQLAVIGLFDHYPYSLYVGIMLASIVMGGNVRVERK